MHWFFLAIVGPFLYATANHIDKILLTKYFRMSGVGTLMLFSSLLSSLALPFLFFIDHSVLDVNPTSVLTLAFVGILNIVILWFYFLALKDDEASVVVVFYQLVPVFGYVLGYLILGEILTKLQLIAMGIIIFGTTIISFEIDTENRFRVRHKTILYMLISSFCWALSSVVFKAVALEENVIHSLFWEHVTLALFGVLLFWGVRSYRQHFLVALKINSRSIILLNFANEIIYMLGTFVFSFAYLLAPVSLVLVTNSFQPIFVFAIGIFLTTIYPNVSVEKIHAYHFWQKIFAIIITGIGTYLLLTV